MMRWTAKVLVAAVVLGSFEPQRVIASEATSPPARPDTSQVRRGSDPRLPVGITEQISTVAGAVSVKLPCGDPIGCAKVYANAKEIASNDLATILGGFPSGRPARWVIYEASSSGNAVPPLPSIVDVSTTPPFVVEDLEIMPDTLRLREAGDALEVSGKSAFATDAAGDPVNVVVRLYAANRIAIVPPYDGKTPFEQFFGAEGGKPVFELLADPAARKPLADRLGTAFAAFRSHLQVGMPVELVDHRYLVGRGCTPHLCGDSEGMFVIDVATGRASAAWYDADSPARFVGEKWRADHDQGAYSALASWKSDHDIK